MKTTVKTTHSGKVTGSRMGPELIAIEFTSPLNFQGVEGVYLTLDAAHVLGMGLVRLAEQAEAEKMAGGVRCHGDACHMGQSPCPSPKACGVAA